MCLIFVAFQVDAEYPLVVGGNRDEFHGRPTQDAGWWPDQPDILGGRDLQAGGTWLEREIPGGTAEQITVYSDYKRFGDLLLPTRTATRVMTFEQVTTFESVEFNTVDEAVYELPEEVKALLKSKPTTQPDEK